MARMIMIRPAEGKKIRDPRNGKPLPADRDMRVELGSYWLRRLKDGDVYEVKEKKASKKKPEPKKKSSEEKQGDE